MNQTSSVTVESILQEHLEYSSYSAEESFTLSDILVEKDEIDDNKLRLDEIIDDKEWDDMFDDEGMFEDDEEGEE